MTTRFARPLNAAVSLLFALAAACTTPLDLPAVPSPVVVPTITSFTPRGQFAGKFITIEGTGFDAAFENNEVHFTDGVVATATAQSTATTLVIRIPLGARNEGPLIVKNRTAASDPSAKTFVPMGYGHPVFGNSVADLRLRHRPVGLINSAGTILLASSLFDVLADDTGRFTWLGGRPVAFVRERSSPGLALVSLRTPEGGRLVEVDQADSEVRGGSPSDGVLEQFILPVPAGGPLVARSLGADRQGRSWYTDWKRTGEALAPTRHALAASQLSGATASDDATYLVAALPSEPDAERVLARLDANGLSVLYRPPTDADVPTGAVAIVDAPGGAVVSFAVANGDILSVPVDGGEVRRIVTISFAGIPSMIPSPTPGKLLATKSLDGSLLQYDVVSGQLDWSVQLRGEPTVIDVSADINQVAVANGEDNSVDIIAGDRGTWLGRISFSLGLGSADGGEGGIAAPYSYDPEQRTSPQVIHVLARNAKVLLALEPGALEFTSTVTLDGDPLNEPLRLAVTSDLRTLVVHRHELGIVEGAKERIVVPALAAVPRAIGALKDGHILVGTTRAVDVYAWQPQDGAEVLVRAGGLALPEGATLVGLVTNGNTAEVRGQPATALVLWRSTAGFAGGLYTTAALVAGGPATVPFDLAGTVGDPTGMLLLSDGPAAFFALSALPGPALFTVPALGGRRPALSSLVERPLLTGATPDQSYAMWLDEGAGEHMVRLLYYRPDDGTTDFPGLEASTGYRLEGRPAGPGFDASGEWLYVPVPKLDTISVFQ